MNSSFWCYLFLFSLSYIWFFRTANQVISGGEKSIYPARFLVAWLSLKLKTCETPWNLNHLCPFCWQKCQPIWGGSLTYIYILWEYRLWRDRCYSKYRIEWNHRRISYGLMILKENDLFWQKNHSVISRNVCWIHHSWRKAEINKKDSKKPCMQSMNINYRETQNHCWISNMDFRKIIPTMKRCRKSPNPKYDCSREVDSA